MNAARRQVAAMMCSGCACRPGTFANEDPETQDDMEQVGERFGCHKTRTHFVRHPTITGGCLRAVGTCAGAVARYGLDEDVAAYLRHMPDFVEAFVSVGEEGVCGHEHQSVMEAWRCAQGRDGFAVPAQLVVPSDPGFVRLTPESIAELAGHGVVLELPPYFVALAHHGIECDHAHWTSATAARCALESGDFEAAVERHDEWPTGTRQRGVELEWWDHLEVSP